MTISVEKIVTGALAVVIAISLLGILGSTVVSSRTKFVSATDHNLTSNPNVSGAGSMILGLLTLVMVVGILVLAVKTYIKK
jgi:hypothetical protein